MLLTVMEQPEKEVDKLLPSQLPGPGVGSGVGEQDALVCLHCVLALAAILLLSLRGSRQLFAMFMTLFLSQINREKCRELLSAEPLSPPSEKAGCGSLLFLVSSKSCYEFFLQCSRGMIQTTVFDGT